MIKHFRKNSSYKYSFGRVILIQMDEKGKITNVIDGKYKGAQSIMIKEKLNKGNYMVLIEMDWVQTFYHEVIVTAYSKTNVNFYEEPTKKFDLPSLYAKILKHLLDSSKDNDKDKIYPSKQYENGDTKYQLWKYKIEKFGLVGLLYRNQEKDIALNTKLDIQKLDNMAIVSPLIKDNRYIELKVDPGKEKFVLFKAKIEDVIEDEQDEKGATEVKSKKRGFEYEYSEMFRLSNVYSKDELKAICKEKGTISQSFLNGTIIVYSYKYLGGLAEYYVNNGEKGTFKQDITFEVQNVLVNGEEPRNMVITVPPKEDFLLDMAVKDMSKGSKFARKTKASLI